MKIIFVLVLLLFIPLDLSASQLKEVKNIVSNLEKIVNSDQAQKIELFSRSYEYEDENQWEILKDSKENDVKAVTAEVFLHKGKAVKATFFISSRSGDWMLSMEYFFAEDGKVLYIFEKYRTFLCYDVEENQAVDDICVVKKATYFNKKGAAIKSSKKIYRESTKQKIPETWIHAINIPYYKNLESLPFISLLKEKGLI